MCMTVTIANNIRIEQPTQQIVEWAKNTLSVKNPDYYKKIRLGKWTGGTPETIFLYERRGDDLIIPFGRIRQLWEQYPLKDAWRSDIKALEARKYISNINLYPYQENAAEAIIKAKNGILVMPCGSGKTQTGLEVIARLGDRALWLTHTQDLLNQSLNRAKSVLEIDGTYGKITEGKVDIGSHITFATVQTACRIDLSAYKDCFDVIVVDECLPGNTKIITENGEKDLKNLLKGDIIISYNRHNKKLEKKRVTHLFKYKAHDIVKVKLENGKEIVATKNHPFYTSDDKWVNAENLGGNDYVMCLVQT